MSTNQKLTMSLDEIGKMNRRSYNKRGGFRGSYKNRRDNQYNPSSLRFSSRRRYSYSNQYQTRPMTRGRFGQKNYISSVYRRNPERRRRPFKQHYRKQQETNKSANQEGLENQTRLYVTNLHASIVNTELKKIFENIGVLKRCGIRWDKLGNSLGTADVEYDSPQDAAKAVQCFNNADIEGTIMKVEYSSESNAQKKKSSGPKRIFKKRLDFRNRRRQ